MNIVKLKSNKDENLNVNKYGIGYEIDSTLFNEEHLNNSKSTLEKHDYIISLIKFPQGGRRKALIENN